MSATIITIADAVVSALNAASLSQSFTAARGYVPVKAIEDLSTLSVTVVPATLEGTRISRAANRYAYQVDVGVQKRIGTGPMTEAQIRTACDPLMQFVEEIADLFNTDGTTAYKCTEVRNIPIFAPMHIDEKRVFTSVLSLAFEVIRTP